MLIHFGAHFELYEFSYNVKKINDMIRFSRPIRTFSCLDTYIMIDVQFKEILGFCDTTRLLYKWSIHHRKFNTLQILMSSFDTRFDVHGM